MYGAIPEGCNDVKKVVGYFLSLLTVNGIYNLLCEQDRERNLKCIIRANHAHTGKYFQG